MTDVKLKCGAPGCSYVTEEASVEIECRLLQFHRQDNHVKQEVGDRERRQPGIKLKCGSYVQLCYGEGERGDCVHAAAITR